MDEKNDQIAHHRIVAGRRNPKELWPKQQFASHRVMFQHELKEDALWKRLILKFVAPALLLSVCVGGATIGLGDILAMIFGGGAVAAITPPLGNTAFLVGHAVGTQGYVCLPSTGASWTVNGSRPEATLFAGSSGKDKQIGTHFLSRHTNPNQFAPKPLPVGSATWQSSFDSSKVWAKKQRAIPAGSDRTSCPNSGAIDCLLLQVVGSEPGPAGGKSLTKTTFIQRLNTKGGSAPVGWLLHLRRRG